VQEALGRGETPPPPPRTTTETQNEKLPEKIDLDDADSEFPVHVVTVAGREVHIGAISVGAARKMNWYNQQISKLDAQLLECEDEEQMEDIDKKLRRMQEKLIISLVPEFPQDILDTMPMNKFAKFMELVGQVINNQMGANNPN
jgi:hypothetical protein